MSFGRKVLNQTQAAQGSLHAGGFGTAVSEAPEQVDPYAEQREAFLAEERARPGDVAAPVNPQDFTRPAGAQEPVAFKSNYKVERSDFRSQVADITDRKFGLPYQRTTLMAYFLLFMLAPFSAHRFYCGEYTKGMAQVGLFGGGVVFMAAFPPLGLLLLFFRGFWVFFDFLMIPGMMQRFKDRSGKGPSVMV